MNESIAFLINRIRSVCENEEPSFVLYGSAVLGDFRPGWSDIDMLCIVKQPLSSEQAQTLVGLRQDLQAEYPQNPYFRAFEGHICDANALENGGTVVYWGTSGQRIKTECSLDPFSRLEICEYGRVICGEDLRKMIARPTQMELNEAVRMHYRTIREHGSKTGKSLYSAGWILDIARCLYTLETGGVIGKTQAGEWALEQGCAGDEETMRRVLRVRREPLRYWDEPNVQEWLSGLGPAVQRYADVLERKLLEKGIE